jgi:hypothetical protein
VLVACSSNYQHMVEESWKDDEHQKNLLKSSYSAMLNLMLCHLHCYEPPARPNQNHAAHFLPQCNKECIINPHCSHPDMQHGQKPWTACWWAQTSKKKTILELRCIMRNVKPKLTGATIWYTGVITYSKKHNSLLPSSLGLAFCEDHSTSSFCINSNISCAIYCPWKTNKTKCQQQ